MNCLKWNKVVVLPILMGILIFVMVPKPAFSVEIPKFSCDYVPTFELIGEYTEANIDEIKDPIFVLLPESSEYIPLTKEIYKGISEGKYRF